MSEPREPPAKSSNRFWLLAMIAMGAATVLVYVRSLGVPFVFDDQPAIVRNASIRHLWPLSIPLNPPNTAAGAAGRPMVNLTLALNYAAGGLTPAGYHAFNLALHLAAVLVFCAVLRRTLEKIPALRAASETLAALAGLLWAVHPIATESVVCVIQRNELLAALFLLLTLYGFIRATEPGAGAGRWQIFSVLCCALGMTSKEVMVGAPLLVGLYDRTFVAGNFREAWRARGKFYLGLASTWALLAWLVARHEQRSHTVGFGLGTTPWEYLVTQCRALALYLKLVMWPHPLVLDYGFEIAPGLGAVWPQALLIAGLLAAAGWALVRRPAWGFVGAVFFVILAPSSSFLPLTTQTIAEHRMYLPLAAVIAALVIAGWKFAPRAVVLVGCGVAVVLGGVTLARVEVYRSEERVWRETLVQVPGNARAHASLANVFVREERWPEALGELAEAVRLRPDYADAQNDYANVLARVGRFDEAIAHYAAAWRLKPAEVDIRYNLALALMQAGRTGEAIAHFRGVIAAQPRHVDALNNLGVLLHQLGRSTEALKIFEAALAVEPESAASHNNAGIALVALGRYAEAVTHYERALRAMPVSAALHHNVALALDGARRGAEAIAHEEAALKLQPDFPAAREHLADLRAAMARGR